MAGGSPTGRTLTASVARLIAAVAVATASALVAVLAWTGAASGPAIAIAAGIVLLAFAVAGWLLIARLAAPLDDLALDLAVIARDNPDHALRAGTSRWLIRVTGGIEALRQSLSAARRDKAAALAEATAQAEDQKRQLEAILLDLSEGIVVCNLHHQVLLYNPAAAALFEARLGLGRSLFTVLSQEPILHALERIHETTAHAGQVSDRFVCASLDGRLLVLARIGMIAGGEKQAKGYVLAMRDISAELAAMARRDNLLLSATEGFRAPVASLRAAAETLSANPDMAPSDRARFERVLLEESTHLSERIEELARGYRDLGNAQWFMAEIHSNDLLASLQRRLAAVAPAPVVTPVGLPAWLYGDSLSLLVLLEHLVRRLSSHLGIMAFDAAITHAERRVYLDFIWEGQPIAPSVIEGWLDVSLVGGLGPLTGRAVLNRHGSELWSQAGRDGQALLRMPLPSAEPVVGPPPARPPARPEFYDFELLKRPLPTGELVGRPLRQVSYVVLDLETTGLRPSEGDEVVAIAAVRVVNGRVLTMETFDRLVNPGRSIPAVSVAIHGITEEDVKDKPPLAVVLPQFQSFAEDAVLVAHNAAFDMAFLQRSAEGCGLRFDQPILDTLLLSAHLDPDETDHSLDGIAARLGLKFSQRHSALSDCLVTAAILVRQIERLEERGFRTLGELIEATRMTAEIRARQREF